MTQIKKLSLLMLVIVVVIIASITSNAHAAFVLTIDDLATTGFVDIVIVDDDDGTGGIFVNKDVIGPVGIDALDVNNTADGFSGAGKITYAGTLGVFSFTLSSGLSKPAVGDSGSAKLDLFLVASSKSAGSLEVSLSDTDFVNPVAGGSGYFMQADLGSTSEGSVTYEAIWDKGNKLFANESGGPTITTGELGPFGEDTPGGTKAFSDSALRLLPDYGTPYSLTGIINVTHGSGDSVTSGDLQITITTPEPAAITIWACLSGIGLVGAGWRRRRKLKAA